MVNAATLRLIMGTNIQFINIRTFILSGLTLMFTRYTAAIPIGFPVKGASELPLQGSLGAISQSMLFLTGSLPDPRENDVNRTMLMKMLGSNFDPRYMSVDPPVTERSFGSQLLERSITYDQGNAGAISERLRRMHFKIRKSGGGKKRLLGEKASSKLRQWLWELSRCPVEYKWIDIGKKFFPRYIREGSCVKKQCSFPKGMTCEPANKKPLKILIWLCFNETAGTCGWRKLLVGTVTTCKCSCRQ